MVTGRVALCAVASYYRVQVSSDVAASADWQARVTNGDGFRHPRGWRWDIALRERALGLQGRPETSLSGCYADLAFARSVEEAQWARYLMRRASSESWCLGLALFDARVLHGLPSSVKRLWGEGAIQLRRVRREERRWRHEWQVFIAGVQKEGAVLTDRAVAVGAYARVPRCWDAYEVPWSFLPKARGRRFSGESVLRPLRSVLPTLPGSEVRLCMHSGPRS